MAAKRPQVAGQIDQWLLEEMEALPFSKAQVVEWSLVDCVPKIKQAVQSAKGGIVVLPLSPSKPGKPHSK